MTSSMPSIDIEWNPVGYDDMTIGELARRLDAMERRSDVKFTEVQRNVDAQFAQARHTLERLDFVPKATHDLEMSGLRKEVAELRQDLGELVDKDKTRVRMLIGNLVFPVLAAITLALVLVK